jgi:hypothetical protein
MRRLVIATIVGTLICGCSARESPRCRGAIVEGSESIAAFTRVAATYREKMGQWPAVAIELANTSGAPTAERLEQLDRLIRLRPAARGLLVTDKRSGDSLFMIATDGRITVVAANDGG